MPSKQTKNKIMEKYRKKQFVIGEVVARSGSRCVLWCDRRFTTSKHFTNVAAWSLIKKFMQIRRLKT